MPSTLRISLLPDMRASMKALPKRKGNSGTGAGTSWLSTASMKALPKRKGNGLPYESEDCVTLGLNESPSQKEGK